MCLKMAYGGAGEDAYCQESQGVLMIEFLSDAECDIVNSSLPVPRCKAAVVGRLFSFT
jgi:hypothetical protein